MKQAFTLIVLLIIYSTFTNAQNADSNFISKVINKKVNEYPNRFDLSSPLNSFMTFMYLQSEGKQGSYQSVNSYRIQGFFPKPDSQNIDVNEKKKEDLLNTKIKEVIVYKDSVAAVITEYTEPMCIITYLSYEDGKWLNAGEDMGNDLNDSREIFRRKCNYFFGFIQRIKELKHVPLDTSTFISYLKKNGETPIGFILNALGKHKIVIYGEAHRRKTSWDFMEKVIINPEFIQKVGTIFMELSSDKQNELDKYFSKDKLDTEIILNIFRDVQIAGWYDKGMYEFLIEIWKLNRTLPVWKRVNVVCVDIPRPFKSFNNYEEMTTHFSSVLDRNEQMARIISETIMTKKDKRNSLFIVGNGHAYKSPAPGFAGGKPKSESMLTAAAQLSKIFSPEEVFTIFQHYLIMSNDGTIHGLIRNGLFDSVFAKIGSIPLAFTLKDSPFGMEPFDGLYEITYDKETGNFENNYDAYLFLGPLESEQGEYLLYDILTDEYVKELSRRANMENTSVEKWFHVSNASKEAIIEKMKSNNENSKEAIIEMLKSDSKNKKRWKNF